MSDVKKEKETQLALGVAPYLVFNTPKKITATVACCEGIISYYIIGQVPHEEQSYLHLSLEYLKGIVLGGVVNAMTPP